MVFAASETRKCLREKIALIVSHRNGRRPGGTFGVKASIMNPSCEGRGEGRNGNQDLMAERDFKYSRIMGIRMVRYLKILNFIWKLKRVEHAMSATWKTMKPKCSIARLFSTRDGGGKQQFVSISRRCQTLRNEMNLFFTNLQYYLMFKVLAYSWV